MSSPVERIDGASLLIAVSAAVQKGEGLDAETTRQVDRVLLAAAFDGGHFGEAIGFFGKGWRKTLSQSLARRHFADGSVASSIRGAAFDFWKELQRYARTWYSMDRRGERDPAEVDRVAFALLATNGGKVPSLRTLERRFATIVDSRLGHDKTADALSCGPGDAGAKQNTDGKLA